MGSIHTITSQYIEAPREIINRLKLPPDKTRVCQQEKLILADDMPIALDIAYLPEEIGLKLTEPLQFGFTYRTLEDNGTRLSRPRYPLKASRLGTKPVNI